MQTCYNCGKEVSDETLICPECGALVKRYTSPPPREAYEQQTPVSHSAHYSAPVDGSPAASEYVPPHGTNVWRDAQGRVRFRAGLTLWLVLCILGAGYLALSFGCTLLVYGLQDTYFAMLETVPEFADLLALLREMMAIVAQNVVLFAILLVFALGAFASAIWLLAAKRRVALYSFVGFTTALAAALLFSGPIFALMAVAGAGVTLLLLRRQIPLLR